MADYTLNRRNFLKKISAAAAMAAVGTIQNPLAAKLKRKTTRPNIIYIMADDLGYGDLGCYGNKQVRTPHLDRMAREGMLFTDFHSNGPVCTPTRAALVTGKYQQRVGLVVAGDFDRYTQVKTLPLEEFTFAEMAKSAGYTTGIFGKWHLGDHSPYLPTRQGFDEWFGPPYSNDMNPYSNPKADRPPFVLYRNEQIIELKPDQDYLTARYTTEAIDFIRRHKELPFLIYIPHSMPHKPVHVSERFAKRFTQEQLDSIKSPYDKESRQFLYPAVIEELDWSVGMILDELKVLGIEQDTLVIFSSDNGPQSAGSSGPLKGGKGSMYEGGHRVPGIFYWPGKIKAGSVCRQTATMVDLMPTWANLCGATLPSNYDTDGMDLTGVLLQGRELPERTIFWRDKNRRAARRGKWKLVVFPPDKEKQKEEKIELYDLERDLGEQNDISSDEKDILKRLKDELDEWEKKVGPERSTEW